MTVICSSCKKPVTSVTSMTSVTLSRTSATLSVNDTLILTATVLPADAPNKNVLWMSNNPTVATVTNGIVTAKDEGTAIITVTTEDGNKTANCIITVIDTTTKTMTIRLNFADNDMGITLGGTGTITIDWGDETVETHTLSTTPIRYKHACTRTYGHIIKITGNNITYMNCKNFQVGDVDVNKNTKLTELYCGGSVFMDKLDVSKNTKLIKLECSRTNLTNLNLSKNTALTELNCYDNDLKSLNISENTVLKKLYCNENELTSLDVSKNVALTELNCEYNKLTNLDVNKNIALIELNCKNNKLTNLDVSKNIALTILNSRINELESLDVSKNIALKEVDCGINRLTAEALNALFGTLHNNSITGGKSINIGGNPGTSKCDRKIATNKGWTVKE